MTRKASGLEGNEDETFSSTANFGGLSVAARMRGGAGVRADGATR